MTTFSFADRYAEASLAPGADIIIARQAPAARIAEEISSRQLLDLAGTYYGASGVNLSWMRDEFAKEDASFSLVNNERETRVLSAIILGSLVAKESAKAILGVVSNQLIGWSSITRG